MNNEDLEESRNHIRDMDHDKNIHNAHHRHEDGSKEMMTTLKVLYISYQKIEKETKDQTKSSKDCIQEESAKHEQEWDNEQGDSKIAYEQNKQGYPIEHLAGMMMKLFMLYMISLRIECAMDLSNLIL